MSKWLKALGKWTQQIIPNSIQESIWTSPESTKGRFVCLNAPLPPFLLNDNEPPPVLQYFQAAYGTLKKLSTPPLAQSFHLSQSSPLSKSPTNPVKLDDSAFRDIKDAPILNPTSLFRDSAEVQVSKDASAGDASSQQHFPSMSMHMKVAPSKVSSDRKYTSPHKLKFQTKNFPNNRITTARYTLLNFIPKQVFRQFSKLANVYFLIIACLQQVPDWSSTGQYTTLLPLVLFVGLAMVREAYDDWLRKRRDEVENKDSIPVMIKNENGISWHETLWEDLKVGDIVRVDKDCAVPADLILLRTSLDPGLCYIQTSQLDGESNLKQKQAISTVHDSLHTIESFSTFQAYFEAEDPNEDIYSFDGTMTLGGHTRVPLSISNLLLRGTILRNTLDVVGIVIFTGEQTKIRMNANQEKHAKIPNLEKLTNRVVVIIAACVLCLAIASTVAQVYAKDEKNWFLAGIPTDYSAAFFTFIILYNTMVPISLYVTLEIVKLCQAYFITVDANMYHEPTDQPVEAHTASLNEDLGQVSYLFSDKTGTLTVNNMVFRQMSTSGIEFMHPRELEDGSESTQTPLSSLDQLFTGSANLRTNLMPTLNATNGTSDTDALASSDVMIAERLKTLPPSVAHTTKDMTQQLLTHSDHPTSVRITFFIQAIVLCHQVVPEVEMSSSNNSIQLNRSHNEQGANATSSGPLEGCSSASLLNQELPTKDSSANISRVVYQSASPDEEALVTAARNFGFILTSRTASHMSVLRAPNKVATKYQILNTIEFSSARKRMSIILRFPDDKILMLSKGADSTMLERAQPYSDLSSEEQATLLTTRMHLKKFASAGLRTLVYAVRYLSAGEYEKWSKLYLQASTSVCNRRSKLSEVADIIEKNWTIIGATGIEDRLQNEVPDVIRMLGRANIKIWMVTGDKKETAISVGHASGLIAGRNELLTLEAFDEEGGEVENVELEKRIDQLISEMQKGCEQQTENPKPISRRVGYLEDSGPLVYKISSTLLQASQAMLRVGATHHHPNSSALVHRKGSTSLSHYKNKSMCVMVIDGPTIARLYSLRGPIFEKFMRLACSCTSVLCCRVSPLQKSLVVKCVRLFEPHKVTAAIGDGANDVAMIQQAHVGIGLFGREGMQAARSSDYSIASFSFLKRLLLVHGHWSYIRVCKFTLGTFYKCIMFYFTQAFYQAYTGYSGTSFYEQWTLTMYNIIFSSLPVIMLGIFDRDLNDTILCEFPEVYRVGQRNSEFNTRIFLLWMLKSIAQSSVAFFVGCFLHIAHVPPSLARSWAFVPKIQPADTSGSLYLVGTVCYTTVVITATLQICIISPSAITWPLYGCGALTIFLWFIWEIVYSSVWPRFGIYTGYEQAGIWDRLVNFSNSSTELNPHVWWAAMMFLVVLCCAPEWAFLKLRRYYRPRDLEKLEERDLVRQQQAQKGRKSSKAHNSSKKTSKEAEVPTISVANASSNHPSPKKHSSVPTVGEGRY